MMHLCIPMRFVKIHREDTTNLVMRDIATSSYLAAVAVTNLDKYLIAAVLCSVPFEAFPCSQGKEQKYYRPIIFLIALIERVQDFATRVLFDTA